MIVERLRELRNVRKLSQKDFAKALNVAQQTVASWERGRTEPSNTALREIAEYFNVSTDYLLGRDSSSVLLSKKQSKILCVFDGLNDEGQNTLLNVLGSLEVSHSRQNSSTSSVVQKNSGGTNFLAMGGNNKYSIVAS